MHPPGPESRGLPVISEDFWSEANHAFGRFSTTNIQATERQDDQESRPQAPLCLRLYLLGHNEVALGSITFNRADPTGDCVPPSWPNKYEKPTPLPSARNCNLKRVVTTSAGASAGNYALNYETEITNEFIADEVNEYALPESKAKEILSGTQYSDILKESYIHDREAYMISGYLTTLRLNISHSKKRRKTVGKQQLDVGIEGFAQYEETEEGIFAILLRKIGFKFGSGARVAHLRGEYIHLSIQFGDHNSDDIMRPAQERLEVILEDW